MGEPQDKAATATLIAAGVGRVKAFEEALRRLGSAPSDIIFIEPMATAGGRHAMRQVQDGRATALDGILSAESGRVNLISYNMPGLRSLRPPLATMARILPNLHEREHLDCARVPVAELVQALEGHAAPYALRLDLPGNEGAVLVAFEAAGLLTDISEIIVRSVRQPLFEGEWTAEQITGWLEARHFDLIGSNNSDPEWPELLLRRNPLRAELALRAQCIVGFLDEQASLTAREAEATTRQRQAEEALAAAQAQADEQSAEAAARIDALQGALAEAEARETEATTRQRQAEEALAALQLELKQVCEAKDDALTDRDAARADLRLSLRLQAMAQADLEALRERFAISEDARAAQESLLQRLTVRLRQAAAQLDLLHGGDQGGPDDDNNPESGGVRKLARDTDGDWE